MTTSTNCPEKSKLVEYLLGKLPDPETEFCEGHIAQCDQCEDTIRGLNINDTLDELTREALADDSSQSESEVMNQLLGAVREIPTSGCQQHARLTLERSAEITRHLSPPGKSGDIGRIGHYRITDLLGAGSTGVVYQAIDEKLDRVIALKILRPSLGSVAQTRFLAEAKSAAAVDHENVITIYEVGEDNELAFMAMQLLPGETLDARLQREAILSEETTRNIAADVAAGLAAAHEKDLIHRDIKPANIWLTRDDRAKILDFGLARVVDDDPGFTSTGMIAGTPSYMSPEQAKGHGLDGRSDLFSLGCIVYRAATGRQPFGATNVLATLQAIQSSDPVPPVDTTANVSAELSDLTMCLLEKLPANRPNSALEVVDGLRKPRAQWAFPVGEYHKKDRLGSTKAEQKPAPLKPKTKTGIGWFGQLATLLLLCAIGGGGFLFSSDIIKIITGYGELTIETDDPNVKIELLENGKVVRIIDAMTDKKIDIKQGKYTLQVAGEENSVQVTPTDLSISRGGKEIVRVHSSPVDKKESATTEIANRVDLHEVNSEATVRPGSGEYELLNQIKIFAQRKTTLENRIAKLKAGLSKVEQKESYELTTANLEKVEHEIYVCFQHGLRLSQPQKIAKGHSLLRQQVALLKQQGSLLLPSLSGDEDDSPEWENYRLMKTKRSLALGQLTNFESTHGLPNSLPRYDGKALHEYLEIIETERDSTALSQAYEGATKLSDQFGTRGEFLDLVRELFTKHGRYRNYLAAVSNSVSVLSDSELQDLILRDVIREGDESARQCIHSLFQIPRTQAKLERVFADSNQLWEAILEVQPESQARSLIKTFAQYTKLRPQRDDLLKKAIRVVLARPSSESDPAGKYTTGLILKLDPQSELLAERVRRLYDLDKDRAFEFYYEFDPESPAARDSISFLVQLAVEKSRTRTSGRRSNTVRTEAIITLARYCESPTAAKKIAEELTLLIDKPELETVVESIFKAGNNDGLIICPAMIALRQKLAKIAAEKKSMAKTKSGRTYTEMYQSKAPLGALTKFMEDTDPEFSSSFSWQYLTADKRLIISGTKGDHELIKKALETLDLEPNDDKE